MIYISLGANLPSKHGTPTETLRYAIARLQQRDIVVARQSDFYTTSALPKSAQPDFVNAVVGVETKLEPRDLMIVLHDIEMECGRKRSTPNAARTLDLDLLDYQGKLIKDPVLPHMRMDQRLFVLKPLQDIAPEWVHPATKEPINDLIEALSDSDQAITKSSL